MQAIKGKTSYYLLTIIEGCGRSTSVTASHSRYSQHAPLRTTPGQVQVFMFRTGRIVEFEEPADVSALVQEFRRVEAGT